MSKQSQTAKSEELFDLALSNENLAEKAKKEGDTAAYRSFKGIAEGYLEDAVELV